VCCRNTETFQKKVPLPITVVFVVISDYLYFFLSLPPLSAPDVEVKNARSTMTHSSLPWQPLLHTHTLMPTLITDTLITLF